MIDCSIEEQGTGRVMASGQSVNVAYDYAAGQSIPIPADWRATIEAFEGAA